MADAVSARPGISDEKEFEFVSSNARWISDKIHEQSACM
jgi:hypothetical protein